MVCGFLWAHTDRTDLTGFLCGWEILWMLSAPLLPRAHTDLTDSTLSFVGGKSHGGSTVCGFLWTHTDSTRFNKKIICGNL